MDPGSHCLLDGSKAVREIAYRDAVPALQAMAETVAWYLQNPLTEEAFPNYPDPFNYAGEDQLISAYQRGIAAIKQQAPFEKPVYHHSYAHPKKPGEGPDHRGR